MDKPAPANDTQWAQTWRLHYNMQIKVIWVMGTTRRRSAGVLFPERSSRSSRLSQKSKHESQAGGLSKQRTATSRYTVGPSCTSELFVLLTATASDEELIDLLAGDLAVSDINLNYIRTHVTAASGATCRHDPRRQSRPYTVDWPSRSRCADFS